MLPKEKEENLLDEAAVGLHEDFLIIMVPGHNGSHVKDNIIIVKALLKDDPNPMVEKPVK
jgi:hypothetical protein